MSSKPTAGLAGKTKGWVGFLPPKSVLDAQQWGRTEVEEKRYE